MGLLVRMGMMVTEAAQRRAGAAVSGVSAGLGAAGASAHAAGQMGVVVGPKRTGIESVIGTAIGTGRGRGIGAGVAGAGADRLAGPGMAGTGGEG
jgi:hypothetical protein